MPLIDNKPTTISSWLNAALDALEAEGIDRNQAIRESGLDPETLNDPDGRVETAVATKLWEYAVSSTKDDCIGIKAASFIKPTTFHALGFSLLVSDNMMDGFERVQRFYKIITDAIKIHYTKEDDLIMISQDPADDEIQPSAQAVDMSMASILVFARQYVKSDFSPIRLELMRAEPNNPEKHHSFFNCDIRFGQTTNRLVFTIEDMLRPLPSANSIIAEHNDQIVEQYLSRFDKETYSRRVHERLIELLPSGNFSIEALASSMHTSARSLHRHLQKEDVAYQDILNDVRKSLAEKYLADPNASITEIAFKLGYNDASNFSRAFKRWVGFSPNEYRNR